MKTPMIDALNFARALTFGHIMDIGQVTPEMKKVLERNVRRGKLTKCFTFFPGLIVGISPRKTTYVKCDSSDIDPLVDKFFKTQYPRHDAPRTKKGGRITMSKKHFLQDTEPYCEPFTQKQIGHLLIPYDLLAAIKAAAFRESISMNKWILKAVRNEVERSKDNVANKDIQD